MTPKQKREAKDQAKALSGWLNYCAKGHPGMPELVCTDFQVTCKRNGTTYHYSIDPLLLAEVLDDYTH